MTTDAKIGLLLGLVFIVIIAFVINGLPSFHKSPSSNDLTNNYVTEVGKEPIGLADNHRRSLDEIDNDANGAVPQVPLITKNEGAADATQSQSPVAPVNSVIETSLPINDTQAQAQEALAPADTAETQQANLEKQPSDVAAGQKATVYIVKKGDNLGQIAQDHYGTQGAKKENVAKIVKANHLKSENQIYIGQKLVIPSPAVLSETNPAMFEKVQSIGRSLASSASPKDTRSGEKGLRDYVVKAGDYPWKIAAKELGNPNRYKEIFKYNPNINEKTTLSIGMHLKLPSR
jgi:nucleoid-associated protein YgaU